MAHNHRVTESFDYNAICDVCGFKYKASFLRKRWDGLMVCEADYEQRHIADFYATRNDTHILPYIRSKEGLTAYPHLGSYTVDGSGVSTVSTGHTLTSAASAYYITNTTTTSHTVMGWAKIDTETRFHTMFTTRGGGSANSYSWYVGGSQAAGGAMYAGIENNGGVTLWRSDPGSISIGKWVHVAWVTNGSANGTTFIYLNGMRVAHNGPGGTTSMTANGNAIYIGRSVAASNLRSSVASFRDVRFWNRALTALEVQRNVNNMNTFSGSDTGLIGWWKLNDTTGTYLDSCTNGVAMNMTNTSGLDLTTEYDYH